MYRIIIAVGIHIITQYALSCRDVAVRVNKPMRLRVVVTRLQEVEACLGIVVVASVPYRVDVRDMGRVGAYVCITAVGYIQQLSPRAVVIPCHHVGRRGVYSHYIAHRRVVVVIGLTPVLKAQE